MEFVRGVEFVREIEFVNCNRGSNAAVVDERKS